eukprot:659968-Amphidinium_carterae.15
MVYVAYVVSLRAFCIGNQFRSGVSSQDTYLEFKLDNWLQLLCLPGDGHACAILTTGKVKCWGMGSYLGYDDSLDRGAPLNRVSWHM